MRWRTRFMQAFDKVAIPNVTSYWVALQVLCLFLIWGKTDFANQLQFDAAKALNGEWWRAITFLFMPGDLDPIWAAFALYFFWMMGTALEANWGTGRYNLFLWVGALLNLASAFIPLALGLPGEHLPNHPCTPSPTA